MKVLSIKEPWASLIIEGKKTLELRTWSTRYRGPLLIHRSGKCGGIVGVVELVDIVQIESSTHFLSLRDKHQAPDTLYQEGLYGWILKNTKPIAFIPCKGQLGLWEPSDEILKQI